MQSLTCWVLTEGIAGTENQCLGIAEAMGGSPVIKRIKLKAPWKQLSPWLRWGHAYALTADSSPLVPPWPDLIIASGRKSVGPALMIKHASGGKTVLVQVQDPKISSKNFDLVIAPQHDSVSGDNVLTTVAAPNRITPEKLETEKQKWLSRLSSIPSPRLAVLIGGNSRAHQMTPAITATLADQLIGLVQKNNVGLLVTVSRRTDTENTTILRKKLNHPNVFFWDGQEDNPYFAFLAAADYIMVSEDSVSMTSEAITTGKPVYIAKMSGGARRLDLFHKFLQEKGYTRPFQGTLESWSYTPPNDTLKAAQAIRQILKK